MKLSSRPELELIIIIIISLILFDYFFNIIYCDILPS